MTDKEFYRKMAGEQARAGMSRLLMLPGRAPAPAARLSRPGDSRSVAEALYEESLGDDAGFMLCELLDLHANRTGQNTARHVAAMRRSVSSSGSSPFQCQTRQRWRGVMPSNALPVAMAIASVSARIDLPTPSGLIPFAKKRRRHKQRGK